MAIPISSKNARSELWLKQDRTYARLAASLRSLETVPTGGLPTSPAVMIGIMPLQRQNLHVLPEPAAPGTSLDELLGPPTLRPGELHVAYAFVVPGPFRASAVRSRTPVSLAVTVVVERELALAALPASRTEEITDLLDTGAQEATVSGKTSCDGSAYVRQLVALLHGHGSEIVETGPEVVPVRVSDRLRITRHDPQLNPADIGAALRWELAAMLDGQTISEWSSLRALWAGS